MKYLLLIVYFSYKTLVRHLQIINLYSYEFLGSPNFCRIDQTSPPSAWEAAMSAMQHEVFF